MKQSWVQNLCLTSASVWVVLLTAMAVRAEEGRLEVVPVQVRLDDAYAHRQLLVSLPGEFGAVDVTTKAGYRSLQPGVAEVDAQGYVAPVAPGMATIEIELAGWRTQAAVEVGPLDKLRPVHFAREVEPLLTRYGCNAGGCHGKANGQNGFKLSLFGFDAEYDYQALVLQDRGRRVFPAAPDRSLLLAKASGAVAHGGGRRFDDESEAYLTLRRWIEQGMPREAPDAPTVTGLAIEPARRIMSAGSVQQLAVVVRYSDGSRRDVTREAQYETNQELVATVGPTGLVEAHDASGEAAIMARYMGQVAVFKVVLPQGKPLAQVAGFTPKNFVDELVLAKWKSLGIQPSRPCGDAEFLRRVTLDLTGRLPTVDEAKSFLADGAADKRARTIDRLLDSPEYSSFFAMRWGTILRNSQDAGSAMGAYAFHNWLRDMLSRNRPYDELVRGVITAAGHWSESPPINWYWQTRDDPLHQVTADAAQVFLGLRLQCAQCHHHPYERWSQDDFYGLAGFFNRVSRKGDGEPPAVYFTRTVSVGTRHPRTGEFPQPKLLDGPVLKVPPEQDVRHVLVDWMAKPDNPFFAKALVNRYWGHMFAVGLVDPVDDMRETNPPSNPELLDALARDFVDHGFDMKHLLRTLAASAVYQLSSEPSDSNRRDTQNYARYYARRIYAEVLLDAVDQTCGSRSHFGGMSRQARVVDLPHEGFGSYFLETFGRPKRVNSCECARSSGANLSQVLLLANSDEVENKVAGGGRIENLVKSQRPATDSIEELYLAAFSRRPTAGDLARTTAYVEGEQDKKAALEDILWALLNSREFVFNH